MKKLTLMILIAGLFSGINSFAQVPRDEEFTKSTKIIDEHYDIKFICGTWRQIYKFSNNTPNPTYGKGETVNKIIFQNRYIVMDSEYDYESLKIQTKMILGYNPIKEKYTIFAIDAITSLPLYGEGDFDKENKEFRFIANEEVSEDGIKSYYQVIFKFERSDKYIFNLYFYENGEKTHLTESANILQER